MGWLPSIFGGDKPKDPRANLDPKLRAFLDNESPSKHGSPPGPEQPAAAPASVAARDGDVAADDAPPRRPTVPRESLYPDGRYAHLWKGYRSFAEVERETATEQEKLANVLEGYKARKDSLAAAAMENCAFQQEEWIRCMKDGSWDDRLQMCRRQVQRFDRCYTMQSRFLRALGYGSVRGRATHVDEDMQMHADKLFNRMLRHEEAVAEAKAAGRPVPVFDSVVPKATAKPEAEVEQAWRETLGKLPEAEREAEEAALRGDYQAKQNVARDIRQILESSERKAKGERRAAGQGSFADALSALWNGKDKGGEK